MSRDGAVEAYVVVQAEHGSAAAVLIAWVRLGDPQDVDILLVTRVRTLEGVLRALACPVVSYQRAFR
jgi:hypothetical protein